MYVIRDDINGHRFPDGGVVGPHFNDEAGNHYFWRRE